MAQPDQKESNEGADLKRYNVLYLQGNSYNTQKLNNSRFSDKLFNVNLRPWLIWKTANLQHLIDIL